MSTHEPRAARVQRLRAKAEALFPGAAHAALRAQIERSFLVPQWGDYHHEGMFMDSHLAVILDQTTAIAECRFPAVVSASARAAMARAIERDRTAVERYVFLHDIAKADCLTVRFGDGADRAVRWTEWVAFLEESPDGRAALEGDEAALRRVCEARGIRSIAYYQDLPGDRRRHGEVGAAWLRKAGIEDETMLAAIAAHEVAYQFARIQPATYGTYFGTHSEAARDFALLASFVDTMASLRGDGRADLTNFAFLQSSRETYEVLRDLEARLAGAPLDRARLARALAALRNDGQALSADALGALEARLRAECGLPVYDLDALATSTRTMVEQGVLSPEERERVLDLAGTDPGAIGRTFGRRMTALRPLLDAAARTPGQGTPHAPAAPRK